LKNKLFERDEEIKFLKLQVNLLSHQLNKESVDQILGKLSISKEKSVSDLITLD
jgi:hypothetical protein